jgi:hypothetical protein
MLGAIMTAATNHAVSGTAKKSPSDGRNMLGFVGGAAFFANSVCDVLSLLNGASLPPPKWVTADFVVPWLYATEHLKTSLLPHLLFGQFNGNS